MVSGASASAMAVSTWCGDRLDPAIRMYDRTGAIAIGHDDGRAAAGRGDGLVAAGASAGDRGTLWRGVDLARRIAGGRGRIGRTRRCRSRQRRQARLVGARAASNCRGSRAVAADWAAACPGIAASQAPVAPARTGGPAARVPAAWAPAAADPARCRRVPALASASSTCSPVTRRMFSLSPAGKFGLEPEVNGGFHQVL